MSARFFFFKEKKSIILNAGKLTVTAEDASACGCSVSFSTSFAVSFTSSVSFEFCSSSSFSSSFKLNTDASTLRATRWIPFSVALSVSITGVSRLMYLHLRSLGLGHACASLHICSTSWQGSTGRIVFMKKTHSMPTATGEKTPLTWGF